MIKHPPKLDNLFFALLFLLTVLYNFEHNPKSLIHYASIGIGLVGMGISLFFTIKE